jgi:hypothetical protein
MNMGLNARILKGLLARRDDLQARIDAARESYMSAAAAADVDGMSAAHAMFMKLDEELGIACRAIAFTL